MNGLVDLEIMIALAVDIDKSSNRSNTLLGSNTFFLSELIM